MAKRSTYLKPAARRLSVRRQLLALASLDGLTQGALAELVGRTPATLSQVLGGQRTSRPTLEALAEWSGIPVAELKRDIQERAETRGSTTPAR